MRNESFYVCKGGAEAAEVLVVVPLHKGGTEAAEVPVDLPSSSSLPFQSAGESRLYHPECFLCSGCGTPIADTDLFTLLTTGVLLW